MIYLYSDDSPYSWVRIDYSDGRSGTDVDSIEGQIPEATDFRTEECDSFGPLVRSFVVNEVRFWYG